MAVRMPPEPPLRALRDYQTSGLSPDKFHVLASATTIYVNSTAIEADFNGLGGTLARSTELLLGTGRVMSETQVSVSTINSPFVTANLPLAAGFRPPRYGRACVREVTAEGSSGAITGLLDIKGCGVRPGQVPSSEVHGTGLLAAREAIYELLMQSVVDHVFAVIGAEVFTLPTYAIMLTGSDVISHTGEAEPTALLLRRAHRRKFDGFDNYPERTVPHAVALQIERKLRAFGVTSCRSKTRYLLAQAGGTWRCSFGEWTAERTVTPQFERFVARNAIALPLSCELLNVQLGPDAELTPLRATLSDFGQYEVREAFSTPWGVVGSRPWQVCRVYYPGLPRCQDISAEKRINLRLILRMPSIASQRRYTQAIDNASNPFEQLSKVLLELTLQSENQRETFERLLQEFSLHVLGANRPADKMENSQPR